MIEQFQPRVELDGSLRYRSAAAWAELDRQAEFREAVAAGARERGLVAPGVLAAVVERSRRAER